MDKPRAGAVKPFVSFEGVSVRLADRWVLRDIDWRIHAGENWVIWGPNGAGKTTLAKALLGRAAIVQGRIVRHYEADPDLRGRAGLMAWVSSEQAHRLDEQERWRDEMRHFSGSVHDMTRAADLLAGPAPAGPGSRRWQAAAELLGLDGLTGKPQKALSSGEMRKLLIGRALKSDPVMLVLDEPFDGLDVESRVALRGFLSRIMAAGVQLLLITHHIDDIPDGCTHVLRLDQGRLAGRSSLADFLNGRRPASPSRTAARPAPGACENLANKDNPEELLRLNQVTVRYGGTLVLDRVSWTVRGGEHWAVIGPNGSGKTTLFKILLGEQLQAYANEIHLFGHRKGTGETVWENRRSIGAVSDDLQTRYQRDTSALDVIASGFFDSIGLYRRCCARQRAIVEEWVRQLELPDGGRSRFHRLSFGQQRMLLIARAMVKSPRLLILDEPANGLDPQSRQALRAMLDRIAEQGQTTLLYATHREDELPACINRILLLDSGRVVRVQVL